MTPPDDGWLEANGFTPEFIHFHDVAYPPPARKEPRMSRYIKTICAVLGGVSTWGITAAADNAITQVELFGLLGVLSTSLAVYAFPNTPPEGEPADPMVSERDV